MLLLTALLKCLVVRVEEVISTNLQVYIYSVKVTLNVNLYLLAPLSHLNFLYNSIIITL